MELTFSGKKIKHFFFGMYLQSVRLFDHSGRMCFSGICPEFFPLPLEKVGPELQSSRRLGNEAAVGWT